MDIDTTAKKPATGEIATVAKDITLPAYGGIMRSGDDVLAAKAAGRGLAIYDDLERDPWVYACLQKRKLAVIARPWTVEPASESRRDKAAAERVRRQIERLDFDALCYHLLDAILKGYAVAEIMWAYDGAEIVVADARPKNALRFLFDEAGEPRLKTTGNAFTGEALPPRKFLVHRYGAKDGNPNGLGLGHKLWWPVYFKRSGISYWLQFVEKFGAPTVLGKYQPGTNLTELEDALARIAHDAGVAIPEGAAIELIEATRAGNGTQEQLIRYMDEQIAAAVLNDGGGGRGGGGEMAAAAILRNEVRLELVQADADLLASTLADLAAWITHYNDPAAQPPGIHRGVTEPEDLKLRAERDKILVDIGFRPTLAYIQEHYGGEWELSTPPEPPPVGRNSAAYSAGRIPGPAPEFAEADPAPFPDQQALDAALDVIPPETLQALMEQIVGPLIEDLRRADGFDAALSLLETHYPEMDASKLEALLARVMFASGLWGQARAGD